MMRTDGAKLEEIPTEAQLVGSLLHDEVIEFRAQEFKVRGIIEYVSKPRGMLRTVFFHGETVGSVPMSGYVDFVGGIGGISVEGD